MVQSGLLRSRFLALATAAVLTAIFSSPAALAKRHGGNGGNGNWGREDRPISTNDKSIDSRSGGLNTGTRNTENDSDLVRAVNDRRNVNFVEAGGVIVSRILPDDTQGLPHQKWVVKLSNGKEVQAVYNSDMGKRVPVKIGTVMAMGGEFKMTNIGPLIHWLHRDPRGTRPDGYVIIDGVKYGDN